MDDYDSEKRNIHKRLKSMRHWEERVIIQDRSLLRQPNQVGRTRQVIYVISHEKTSEQWDVGLIVPYDEIDPSMKRKPKVPHEVLIRMFEDGR
jgi:hypothetical protein